MRLLFALLAIAVGLSAGGPEDLERARKLYERTDYEASLKTLEPLKSTFGKPAAVHELIGQNLFMQGDYKGAVDAFEQAISLAPTSNGYMWLGRAYGRRAESANPFSAPGLAIKTRQNFEKAVELDRKNVEAMSDLLEYYLEAPGFLGGGVEKAVALTRKIAAVNAVEYEFAEARISEDRKDWKKAEHHYRNAVELAPREAGRLVDLANFLVKLGRHQEAENALMQAAKVAPGSPKVLFAQARYYVQSKRNLPAARELLQRFLTSQLTPEDPSREQARKLLKQAGA